MTDNRSECKRSRPSFETEGFPGHVFSIGCASQQLTSRTRFHMLYLFARNRNLSYGEQISATNCKFSTKIYPDYFRWTPTPFSSLQQPVKHDKWNKMAARISNRFVFVCKEFPRYRQQQTKVVSANRQRSESNFILFYLSCKQATFFIKLLRKCLIVTEFIQDLFQIDFCKVYAK